MKLLRGCMVISLAGLTFTACHMQNEVASKQAVLELPSVPYDYKTANGDNNLPTLGRVLFYDTRMSVNNSVSCASCHKQALAFADNVPFSMGVQGKLTFRNSMPIQNLNSVFSGFFSGGVVGQPPVPGGGTDPVLGQGPSLFWDGREHLLNIMVLRPITNHVEMGIDDLDKLAAKLSQFPEYTDLFQKAFGSPAVDQIRISNALAAFLGSITSTNTRLDHFLVNQSGFTALEQAGHDLFFGKYNCNSCHQTEVANGYQMGGGFVNIGLDERYADEGLKDVTGATTDAGKFKIPTLRNVALTAPYMHDGRFGTLDEVLNHYSENIKNHPNLDQRLRTTSGAPARLNISDYEKQAIISFLNTLTDYSMITDPKFSNPFRQQ